MDILLALRVKSKRSFRLRGQKRLSEGRQANPGEDESEKFNSCEITRVASEERFLGVPYVSVSAGSRHIQESLFLFRDEDLLEVGTEQN